MNSFNPFFTLPLWLLIVTRVYVGIFVCLIPLMKIFFLDLDVTMKEYLLLSIFASVLTALPVILPFKRVGLIHPLVYPFYLSILMTLGKDPLFWLKSFDFSTEMTGTLAVEINNVYTSLGVSIQGVLFNILWTVMLYIGYFVVKSPKYGREEIKPLQSHRFSNIRYYLFSFFFIAAGIAYFETQGGLLAYMNSWGVNRSSSLEGLGPVIIFFTVAFLVPLSWYGQKGGRVFLNPVFVLILAFAMFVRFFASGSRSSILIVVLSFIILYVMQNRRIPWKRAVFAGLIFFVLVGALGKFRQATWRGEASWEEVLNTDIETHVENTLEEGALWGNLGASKAVYLKVPEQVDYLYGKTYVTGLLFFIPRFLWPDKPHSVGYYTGRLIFNRLEAGIPPGDIAEAYWNFSIFGVVVIAFLNGIIYKAFVNYYERNNHSLFCKIIYIMVLTGGLNLSGLAISQLMQRLIIGVPLLKFLKVK